jgi:hypothetical protein
VERLALLLARGDLPLQLTNQWVVFSVETHVEHFVTLSHQSFPVAAGWVFIRVGLLVVDGLLDAFNLILLLG